MYCVHIDEGKNLWVLDALEDWIYFISPIKLALWENTTVCLILKSLKRELSPCGSLLIDTTSEQENMQAFNFNRIPCEETRSSGGNEAPCILITAHYMFDVCSVLTVFQVLSDQRSQARSSEQS